VATIEYFGLGWHGRTSWAGFSEVLTFAGGVCRRCDWLFPRGS